MIQSAEGQSELTAFRAAEKQFKRPAPTRSKRRKLQQRSRDAPSEVPGLLDWMQPHCREGLWPLCPLPSETGVDAQQQLFALPSHPGFYFAPRAVRPGERAEFLTDVAGPLLDPPASTSLTATHGPLPLLWAAAEQGLHLRHSQPHVPPPSPQRQAQKKQSAFSIPAANTAQFSDQDWVAAGNASAAGTGVAVKTSGNQGAPRSPAAARGHDTARDHVITDDGSDRCSHSHSTAATASVAASQKAAINNGGLYSPTAAVQPHLGAAAHWSDTWVAASAPGGDDGCDSRHIGAAPSPQRSRPADIAGQGESSSYPDVNSLPQQPAPASTTHTYTCGAGTSQATAGPSARQPIPVNSKTTNIAEPNAGSCPSAAQLLRKLRWATVGPRYDWTERAYDLQGDHRRLPPFAGELARRLAALVCTRTADTALDASCNGSNGQSSDVNGRGGSVCTDGNHCGYVSACNEGLAAIHQHSSLQSRSAAAAAAAAAAASGERSDAVPGRTSEEGRNGCFEGRPYTAEALPAEHRPFQPDAALVCFYRAGDTLCGHQDDAETDLSQPIVSLSLGCSAVLLVGGRDRSVPPAPLLVRHGDAVIFTGSAREYYHGVPRVFEDGQEAAADAQAMGMSTSLVDFVRHTRINISIRAVK